MAAPMALPDLLAPIPMANPRIIMQTITIGHLIGLASSIKRIEKININGAPN